MTPEELRLSIIIHLLSTNLAKSPVNIDQVLVEARKLEHYITGEDQAKVPVSPQSLVS